MNANAKRYDLTKGPILRTIALYGIPILIAQLIQNLYNFADTLIIGNRLGELYMGAVNASGTTSSLLFSLMFGMASGFGVTIGIAYGSKDEERTRRAIVSSVVLCTLFGLLISVCGISLTDVLVRATNVPADKVEIASRYLIVIFAGGIISAYNNMFTAILRSLGNSRAPVIILSMSAVINVVLNLVFLEFTDLNEVGVALATVISQLCSVCVSLTLLFRTFPQFNFFKNRVVLRRGIWGTQIKMGVPMAFQNSMITIGAVIVQAAVNNLETTGMVPNALASYAVSNSINNISGTLINTFGMVIAGFVSQNYGAKDYVRIKQGVISCLALSWVLSLLLGACLLLFDRPIAGLFMETWSEELYANVHTFLLINVPFYVIWVPVPILRLAIQGMNNAILPFLSCLVELPMRCITAWLFGSWWGYAGISLATPSALVAAIVFLLFAFFITISKKKKEMLSEKMGNALEKQGEI